MVIIVESQCPIERGMDVYKVFGTSPPLPDFLNLKDSYNTSETGVGFRGLVIYEVEQSKIAEAFEALGRRLTRYFDIPGYTFSIKLWNEPEDTARILSAD